MLAISLNRQTTSVELRPHGLKRLSKRSIPFALTLALSASVTDCACGENAPKHPQSAVRVVGAKAEIVAATATAPQREVSTKLTLPAPLAIADYENYIKGMPEAPRAVANPPSLQAPPQTVANVPSSKVARVVTVTKRLEPITPIEVPQPANRPAASTAPTAITFAATTSPAPSNKAMTKNIAAEATTTTVTTAAPAPRIALVQKMRVAQKQLPAPVEPQVETPPAQAEAPARTEAHSETIPMATIDGPPTPLTTSNFLPANPEGYCFRCGVKCPPCGCNPGGPGWAAERPIPWEVFAQGEYVGPARLAHVPVYRLRVDDRLAFVYRLSGQVSGQPYRLNVRDRIMVQSLSAPEVVNREVIVEPDGTITLPLLGQVRASGATLGELSRTLDEAYKRQIRDPRITVTPLVMNSNLEELRSSVDRRYGQGGQVSDARVSPDGTIQLPAIGMVPAQGLTLEELEREIKARYAQIVEGLEVTPILTDRAPRFVYVVGEVVLPGRYAMEGPTTLMQAIALAGSWNVGAQLNHVVVYRRDENWQLMATRVNVRESLLFKKPCPSGEIWLRDSDIVLIPKSPILCADDAIDLLFTRGLYGVFPMSATLNFAKLTSL